MKAEKNTGNFVLIRVCQPCINLIKKKKAQ